MTSTTDWKPVIGLEIHAQLATESKIFSAAPTAFGAAPNSQANSIDLGLPGVLPVLNQRVVEMAVRFGLATDCRIARRCLFARKNYFYPDLPKGYQISQYEDPITAEGHLDVVFGDGSQRRIGITRAHLEEDAGKLLHDISPHSSGVDYNRAGVPLLEIVSEPELYSALEAVAYARQIHVLLRYLEICDGNMQEGSFRCDANVSLRPSADSPLGTRAELKNLNSFRFLERAIDFEIGRQAALLNAGGTVVQETRLFDSDKGVTRSMRSKEEAHDYRYFPDPDLLPVVIGEDFIAAQKDSLPELPDARRRRFCDAYQLPAADAVILTAQRELADYYESTVTTLGGEARLCANWIIGDLAALLRRDGKGIGDSPLSAERLAGLLRRIADGTISGKIGKELLEILWQGDDEADAIIDARGLRQISDDSAIAAMVDKVLQQYPQQRAQYRAGKAQLLGFFVGQIMKESRGKANPAAVNKLLRERL